MSSQRSNRDGAAVAPLSDVFRPDAAKLASDLLPLSDIVCLLLLAWGGALLYSHGSAALHLAPLAYGEAARSAPFAMVLAPFILYDRHFGAVASRGASAALVRSFCLRFAIFAGVVLALGAVGQTQGEAPLRWLALWFSAVLLSTALTRTLLARHVRRLQRTGAQAEVIAEVGAGPVADRLVHALRSARPESIELLGIFDDHPPPAGHAAAPPVGTIAQLIELGKTRRIDWIVLTLPPTATQRLQATVQRLKSLSAPIGLCPQSIGLATLDPAVHLVGDSVPVNLLADRPIKHWNADARSDGDWLPRWILTLAMLPPLAFRAMATSWRARTANRAPRASTRASLQFDDYGLDRFAQVARDFGHERYGYAVTPNADHIIRLHESAAFRSLYASASYILLDSRFVSRILSFTKGIRLPVCTGSDLTEKLLSEVVLPDDALVLIGGRPDQAQRLRERFGLRRLWHLNPPMGFIRNPAEVEACLRFIESHSPFRFCLLAIGAPQQEEIAQRLKYRNVARGLALCIGASINFLTGDERRAPRWMRRSGLEWSYRLLQAPGRMARRYLVRGPRVFGILGRADILLRPVADPERPRAALPLAAASRYPACGSARLTASVSAVLARAARQSMAPGIGESRGQERPSTFDGRSQRLD
jgi:exopolysaccharide biosynthesis WecB/TagA/CpsF family protein